MLAAAPSAVTALGVYRALERRNRVIAALRIVVPLAGLAIFGALGIQMILASALSRDFSIGRVTFERNRLQVETPEYAGLLADGSAYTLSAASAASALDNPGLIELASPHLVMRRPTGVVVTADGPQAVIDTASQLVTIKGPAAIAATDGLTARIEDMHIDLTAQKVTGAKTHIDYPGGQTIDAVAMAYDAKAYRWDFTRATVVSPDLPRGKKAPTP